MMKYICKLILSRFRLKVWNDLNDILFPGHKICCIKFFRQKRFYLASWIIMSNIINEMWNIIMCAT